MALSVRPHRLPITFARRRSEALKLYTDCDLNQRSIFDSNPLWKKQAILGRLPEVRCVGSLDLHDGYWPIQLGEGNKQFTASP